jgi:hypothetical protein
VKSGLPSSSSTSSSAATAADFSKSIATPSRSSQRIGSPTGKETCIAELQSPHTTKVSEVSESHRSQISKKNIANYVHNLSKKTVSMHRDKMTAVAPVKAISKAMSTSKGSRGRPRKSSSSGLGSELVGGMSAAFSPRSGKVVVTATAAKQGSSEDSDDCISDEYNRNMSEEEDGDF